MAGAQGDIHVSVVLPAYNEEANIQRAIDEVTQAADRLLAGHEIIVVDDGSTDATGRIARAAAERDPRIRVISHPSNRHYGGALRSGLLATTLDYVFFTDADCQFDLNEIELMLPFAKTVDVVAGYRIKRQDPLIRRLYAWAWNVLVRVLFYVPVRDIDCAFKLMKREVLAEIDVEAVGAMVNTELMVKLGRRGASVVEVGVHHRPRQAGEARGATPRVIGRAFLELVRMRRRLAHLDSRGA